jgi:3-deoxy-7-phosphoheptulonate synthase
MTEWGPNSWKNFPIKQQPEYPQEKQEELKNVLDELQNLPPLIHNGEVQALLNHLALAAKGKTFILQGGDCAERFQDCSRLSIENKVRILLQMSLVIIWRSHIPVVRILRGAGQYAKPRSSPVEKVTITKTLITEDGTTEVSEEKLVPSFRGDNINGFSIEDRAHDPSRLLQAYFRSASTMNYIRALIGGGFASLYYPHKWTLDFVKSQDLKKEYVQILKQLHNGLGFLSTVGPLQNAVDVNRVEIFTSHEGLVLDYESSLTSEVNGKFYNLGAHFIWIGDRTREINGAHIEYFRGIQNPVGLKCGPSFDPEELERIVKILNPDNIPGKLVLITRYGDKNVEALLPNHIAAVARAGVRVTWICDPMHGNTFSTEDGIKTRSVSSVWNEIEACFRIHKENGSHLGGIHLEMTGENVTECVGGADGLGHTELANAYETYCDPRLNYTQSLDIAFRISELITESKGPVPNLFS